VTLVVHICSFRRASTEKRTGSAAHPNYVDVSNDLFVAVQGLRLERGAATHALDIVGQADDARPTKSQVQRRQSRQALDFGAGEASLGRDLREIGPKLNENKSESRKSASLHYAAKWTPPLSS